MKKGTRRILFWLAVIIFAGASAIAVLVAQGYKYDFTRNVFVRTGAIAVTANTDAQLSVDGQQAPSMSFLAHRTGADRLLPGVYAITVTKDGYSSWHKTATVQEGLLTDFPTLLLLPTDRTASASLQEEIIADLTHALTIADATPLPSPTVSPTPKPKTKKTVGPVPVPTEITANDFTLRNATLVRTTDGEETTIAEHVLGFALTDNSDRVLWWTRNEIWVLWIRSTDYQPFRVEGDQELITRFPVSINRAAWFRDHDHIIVDLGTSGYRIVETDTRDTVNIIKIGL